MENYVCIIEDPHSSGYELCGAYESGVGSIVENRSLLTTFANMDKQQIQRLKDCCDAALDAKSVEEYILATVNNITTVFGESIADIVTLEWKNSKYPSINSEENTGYDIIATAQKSLHASIDAANIYAKGCCYSLSQFFDSDITRQQFIALNMVSAIPPKIRIIPLAAVSQKTNKVTYVNAYCVTELYDFFALMAILTIKDESPMRRCKNCNLFFLPVSKRDEIYCLDCRTVCYDTKIKEDDILRSYRKIYKTQCARKARNAHRPNIDSKFEQWKHMAVTIRNNCRAGLISLEEMETCISSRDWLDGTGGTDGQH